ncbi:hypothetical protein F5146DRAFT_1004863 [Armillaria mellea]|nr:hypothetical protein F5146DRAFT_1004863 [Armillaria mellea]
MTDKFGQEEDGNSKDIVKSWSCSKQEFSEEVLDNFDEIQQDIYGEEDLMLDSKLVLVDGKLQGGIAIEHTFCSKFHVRNAEHAYHLTTSFQDVQGLEAPHQSNKADGIKENDHENLVVHTANARLAKGALEVAKVMEKWLDLTNYPRTGKNSVDKESTNISPPTDEDSKFFVFLLNKDPFVDFDIDENTAAEESNISPQTAAKNKSHSSQTHLKKNIGKYGGNHAILYPSQIILNGESALAFATLPYPPDPCHACQKQARKAGQIEDSDDDENGPFAPRTSKEPPNDPLKMTLLKLPMEWWNYTEQATYLSNDGSFLSPMDHFNHSICSLVQWINGIIQQFPPDYFVHYDKD